VFLSIVATHIAIALMAVVTGAIAMLSPKRAGRHPRFGRMYFWSLCGVVATTSVLSVMRWAENYHLFMLGTAALLAATLARSAVRKHWPNWVRIHLIGMGASYTLLLIAFYVDNGRNLPLWRDLPAFTYWLIPIVIGCPLILWTLTRHPLTRVR
jgi:hypothetical protein